MRKVTKKGLGNISGAREMDKPIYFLVERYEVPATSFHLASTHWALTFHSGRKGHIAGVNQALAANRRGFEGTFTAEQLVEHFGKPAQRTSDTKPVMKKLVLIAETFLHGETTLTKEQFLEEVRRLLPP